MTGMETSNIQHPTSNIQRTPFAKHWMLDVGCWTLDVLKFAFLLLIVFQMPGGSALAAEKLQVDVIPLGLRGRNESPIPVETRFKWNSARILEGQLEMEFHEGNRLLGRYRSGDLALTGGDQRFRMLLPPALAPFSDSQVDVQMKFVTAGSTMEIDPTILSLPTASERSLVVGWCDAGTAGSEASSDLVRNLLFERYAPPADNAARRLMMTSVARLAPEDLPAQPLAYTTFDVVVLTAEAFKEAGERQLQALVRWAQGGGSVCVFVGGGLQAHHIQFLNRLAESAAGPAFLADDAGNLLSPPKDILCLHSGVGRSVIVAGKNAADASASGSGWQRAATFLWKMRRSQAQAIADSGHWEPPVRPAVEYNSLPRGRQFFFQGRQQFGGPASYAVQSTDLGGELMNRLMPTTVRLIPFSALVGLLVLFLLMIGPADYFVLGFLRRRRFTWLLFPATSIAFTVATVVMANHYLGLRDQRRSLVVVDLARDGTALRWNRYELVFAARDIQSVTELKDALWAQLDVRAMPGEIYNPNPNYRSYGYRADSAREAGPPLYEGTLPVHFRSSEAIRQWRPELNRVFSLEPPPVPLFSNWRAIEDAWPNLQNVRAKLSEKKSFRGDVYAISIPHAIAAGSGSTGILPASILEELCVGDSTGLQSLVSQISPTGGSNFEDVQAMDTEARDSALAIVTQNGDDIIVYRRFFYGN